MVGHLCHGSNVSFSLLTQTTAIVTNAGSQPANGAIAMPQGFDPSIQIWSFLPNSDAEETDPETPHYATCVAQLNLPSVGRFARINSLDVPGNTQAIPRDPDTAYLLSEGDTLERVVPIKQSAYRGVCIFRICASWDRPEFPKEGMEGVWAAGSGEQVYGLYVLRETLVQLAREGEARLRDTVTMDTSPRPAATDMGNPDKPCPVQLCACDGGVGGPRVRLSPGQSYTTTTTDQDEHGRTFTGLSGNSVHRRYEWAAWGEKGAHVLSEVCHTSHNYEVGIPVDMCITVILELRHLRVPCYRGNFSW